MSDAPSGFARALLALGEADVDFIVVGVGGINFYARTPAEAYATLDLDTLLGPAVENLQRALTVLAQLGYAFESGDEPFIDLGDALVLGRIIERGASLRALHAETGEIDLLTSIAGFDYAQMSEDVVTFEVSGSQVRVGRLEKLLRSKEAAGRPKDVAFLRAFRGKTSGDD